MPRILIVYGTTTGHTAKIACRIAAFLEVAGATVDVRTGPALETVGPAGYDAIVVAASVHGGSYQKPVQRWVRTHRGALNRLPTMFLSVCLAVLDRRPEKVAEVRAVMDRFLDAAGWRPAIKETVAGALLYTQYNRLERWFMRRIVAKAGGDVDTSRDYEYTDWDAIRRLALDLLARVPASVARTPAQAAAAV